MYHLGVASQLKQRVDVSKCRFAGASAGSLVAAALACNADLGAVTQSLLDTASHVRAYRMGPLNPTARLFDRLTNTLRDILPDTAHELR